ncbi:hypothetical protein [Sulfolobus spindle-shaped virus]|uniref:Uncharacterized protein n=1 Tax=Saccharolobus islandicus (strain M.14.25 / Kamchatka \|nr:hypothetical protein [Sulfolobus islandicus]AZG03080.1 hypothetical protein [Sulfolobus spindle-shaped virus]ACP38577.1 hypothetical protein M1425_1832 [Sulfolobus islandicus M.14.25]AZG03265.1 hypothetical protein [Sulfolobus spindle-shaped virus]AZG03335.1 hypothetical protein [Sulfolobus spindle-shaped virus]AZG03502.1 hypothetical protein [Sulfolobus spindle-shaped virus]
MQDQEERENLVKQSSVFLLLTTGSKKYGTYLHVKIEINEDEKIIKEIYVDDIGIENELRKLKRLYEVYGFAMSDETQEAIRKEVLIEIAKILHLFL